MIFFVACFALHQCSDDALRAAFLSSPVFKYFRQVEVDLKRAISEKYQLLISSDDPLAQSVEHLPFKERVDGSSPSRVTILVPFV